MRDRVLHPDHERAVGGRRRAVGPPQGAQLSPPLPSPPSPPWLPLVRVLTGLPEEPPVEDPDEALVRVVTGPAEPEPPVDPPWPALVRVVTGALPGVAALECELLVRVLSVPAATAADPLAREPLVLVLGTVPVPWEAATAPVAPVALGACSCLTM